MCLIFVGQGYPRKLFNLEHFLIYGSIRFPHLSILAKKFLATPATSTPSQRVFSVASIVVDRK